jgi:hypothetical protein
MQYKDTILNEMTLLRKAVLSLVLALFLFAAFAVSAYTGFFGMIDARFYSPLASRTALEEVERDREVIQSYFTGLDESFTGFIGDQALRRSFLPNQSENDIVERERLAASLGEKHAGLLSVRFIGDDGFRIHYSTLKEDILEGEDSPAYRNYKADSGNMPREFPAVSAKGASRLTLDRQRECIVFSYPYYDALELYRGTAVFTLSSGSLVSALADSGRLGIGEAAAVLEDPPGIILGLPRAGDNAAVYRAAAEIWKQAGNYREKGGLSRFDPGGGNAPLVLVSSQTSGGIFTGRIMGERPFVFSSGMKAVLLLSFFLTSFLTIFLIFNARADPMTVVHARLRGIRAAILEECRSRKNSALPVRSWELEQRREDMHQEIKRILKIKQRGNGGNSAAAQGKAVRRLRLEREIDTYIDLVWNELEALVDRLAMPHGDELARKQEAPRKKAENAPAGPRAAASGIPEAARQAVHGRKEPAAGGEAKQDRAAKLEPVKVQTALLSRPLAFTPELNGKPEPLSAFRTPGEKPAAPQPEETGKPAGEPVFKNRDGITYINKAYITPGRETVNQLELDEKFKNLVDSVINDNDR